MIYTFQRGTESEDLSMLYVAKEFGHYHFFKTYDEREAFIKSLLEWHQKSVLTYEVRWK